MGKRGASGGFDVKGRPYGTEYRTLYRAGNIKFVTPNEGMAKAPMETMTKGRVYVTVNGRNEVRSVTYYDKDNQRFKQIDVNGKAHPVKGVPTLPHTHRGYEHEEHGTHTLTPKEQKMVDRVLKTWYHHLAHAAV